MPLSPLRGGSPMTFHDAVAALQHSFPNAPLGRTVLGGEYRDRAQGLTYNRIEDGIFEAVEPNGRVMWVYHSDAKRRICCGDKDG
jgi:hypothetical protein